MIKIDLIEALQEQIKFCQEQKRYRCGVYVTTHVKRDIVNEVLKNIIPKGYLAKLIINEFITEALFINGNSIKVIGASNEARGHRFNGAIVDNDIHTQIYECVVLPCLVPLKREDGMYDDNDYPKDRLCMINISGDDVKKSEDYKVIRGLRAKAMIYDEKTFEKEYRCMWGGENDFDRPVVEKELNGNKILLYGAYGIPKEVITYETEFINKTKQTYLNIVGKFENQNIGFENNINIHLLVDTKIYDSYEVQIKDGMITVILHEIKNVAPILNDCSVK